MHAGVNSFRFCLGCWLVNLQKFIAIAIFASLGSFTYLLYGSLLDGHLRDGSARAASFSFLSIFAHIVVTVEAERWRRTGEFIVANKLVKFIFFPLGCLLFPIFLDEFVPRANYIDILLTFKGVSLFIVCWLLMCDYGRFQLDFLICQNLLDDPRSKILYVNFPPKRLTDMKLSLGIIIVLFLVVIFL